MKITYYKIVEILRSVGMSEDPKYYSDTSKWFTDMSAETLCTIYCKIKGLDEEKATIFLKMVNSIDTLRESVFLNKLYELVNSDFDLTALDNKTDNTKNKDLSTEIYDKTDDIKQQFLNYLPKSELNLAGISIVHITMDQIENIIRNSNMSSRPEFYSGRGATTSDLNEKILFKIYSQIKEISEEKALTFIKMVFKMNTLGATEFLNSLYNLTRVDFNLNKTKIIDSNADLGNGSKEYTEMMAFITVMSAFRNGRDDTSVIKARFFDILPSEEIKKAGLENNSGYKYYDYDNYGYSRKY